MPWVPWISEVFRVFLHVREASNAEITQDSRALNTSSAVSFLYSREYSRCSGYEYLKMPNIPTRPAVSPFDSSLLSTLTSIMYSLSSVCRALRETQQTCLVGEVLEVPCIFREVQLPTCLRCAEYRQSRIRALLKTDSVDIPRHSSSTLLHPEHIGMPLDPPQRVHPVWALVDGMFGQRLREIHVGTVVRDSSRRYDLRDYEIFMHKFTSWRLSSSDSSDISFYDNRCWARAQATARRHVSHIRHRPPCWPPPPTATFAPAPAPGAPCSTGPLVENIQVMTSGRKIYHCANKTRVERGLSNDLVQHPWHRPVQAARWLP